jgi:serine/threonine-protein kinase RsbW
MAIAVTEAVNNAIKHGNKADPKKKVRIHFELFDDSIVVKVADEGRGFDPDRLRDPLDPENILRESGRGIFILRALMDDVSFCFSDSGTEVTLVKKKK